MEHYNIAYNTYEDDTQLYITVSTLDYSPLHWRNKGIKQISEWMFQNFLQLNTVKTEIIVLAPKKKD